MFVCGRADRCAVDRGASYYMEECVDSARRVEAEQLMLEKGFFEGLPPMYGSIEALHEMEEAGFKVSAVGTKERDRTATFRLTCPRPVCCPRVQVFLCTSPLMASRFCIQARRQPWTTRPGALCRSLF